MGTFSDFACNVSRFMAVARWADALDLEWSNYLSFGPTIFTPELDSIDHVLRPGNGVDRCPHRFSDSMIHMSPTPVVPYSYFSADDRSPVCRQELLDYYKSGFAAEKATAAFACQGAVLPHRTGIWTVQALSALDGGGVNAWPNAYVWGRVQNFAPDEPYSLVVGVFQDGEHVEFGREGVQPQSFWFSSVEPDFSWKHHAAISGPGARPVVQGRHAHYGAHEPGLGHSWGGVPELAARDIDGDGLDDFALESGAWVGYSEAASTVVLKTP